MAAKEPAGSEGNDEINHQDQEQGLPAGCAKAKENPTQDQDNQSLNQGCSRSHPLFAVFSGQHYSQKYCCNPQNKI